VSDKTMLHQQKNMKMYHFNGNEQHIQTNIATNQVTFSMLSIFMLSS